MRSARSVAHEDVIYRGFRALVTGMTAPRARMLDHELHVDADAICPRCMQWIGPDQFVRRTAYGPHQHETCE
jgi:hypothetical protein